MKIMSDVFILPINSSLFEISGYAPVKSRSISNQLEADEHAAHAINNVDALADALGEALLQIAYLHNKFGETGSGNSVLSRGQTALDDYRGTK